VGSVTHIPVIGRRINKLDYADEHVMVLEASDIEGALGYVPADAADILPPPDLSGLAPRLLLVDEVAGASYTIQPTDQYAAKALINASKVTIVVPNDPEILVGSRCRFGVEGAGGAVIAPVGVTIISRDNALDAKLGAIFELHKRSASIWWLLGDVYYLAPAVVTPPAPAGVSGYATNGSGSGPVNVSWVPVAALDIAFIEVVLVDSTATNSVNTPVGFLPVDQQPLYSAADTATKVAVFWRRCDGSELGTVNITCAGGHAGTDTVTAVMSVVRGAVPGGTPFEGLNTAIATSSGMVGEAVTVTGANRLIMHFCGEFTTTSATPAAGYTEQYDYQDGSGTGECGIQLYTKQRTAGAGTEASAMHSLSGTKHWRSISLAVIPTGG
jgi:hypothetical protein